MGNLPTYPAEVRQRAIELIEEKNPDGSKKYSYSQVIEKLREEFPDVKLSKSTLTRWYRQHQKQKAKEQLPEEPKKEEPKKEPKEEPVPKESVEEVDRRLKQLPQIHPDQVVEELNESITPVPEGPLMKEAEPEEPKEEDKVEKAHSFAEKLMANRSKILWSITLTLIIGALVYLIYRWATKRAAKQVYQVPQLEVPQKPQPKPDSTKGYAQIVSPDQFEEPGNDEFASAEVLP